MAFYVDQAVRYQGAGQYELPGGEVVALADHVGRIDAAYTGGRYLVSFKPNGQCFQYFAYENRLKATNEDPPSC